MQMPAVMQRQVTLVALTSAALFLSLISPPFPREQWLQHLPTAAGLVLLTIAALRTWFSTPALTCCLGLIWLHLLGARYIYSCVPYDAWTEALFGWQPSALFGWQRNHYDRLVHLAFGGLCYVPAYEQARNRGRLSVGWAAVFALCLTTALSAVYEIGEWLLTIVVSPAQAQAYNGQQGDFWDAQKDMALALAGSLAVMLAQAGLARRRSLNYCLPREAAS